MKVFVSYTKSDRPYLDELGLGLSSRGVTCLSDRDLSLGCEAWYVYVGRCIEECDAVVALVSQQTVSHLKLDPQAVGPQLQEIDASVGARKRLLVILLNLQEADLPIALRVLLGSGQRLKSKSGAVDADAIVAGLNRAQRQTPTTPIKPPGTRWSHAYLLVGLSLGIVATSLFHYTSSEQPSVSPPAASQRDALTANKGSGDVAPVSPSITNVQNRVTPLPNSPTSEPIK